MATIDQIISSVASPQHGVFSRDQVRLLGVTPRSLRSRVASGAIHVLSHQVLCLAGAPPSEHRDAIAAVLDVRGQSALSHRSAAAYWGLPGFRKLPLEVTAVRRSRTSTSHLATVHTTTCMPGTHITSLDGLMITVPVRVLFDLAGSIHPDRLARLIDVAWRMRLVTGRLLRRTLAELAEHGRAGIQDMRALIEERGDEYRPTDSNVEARFEQIMASIGIRSFVRQIDVGGADWIGRVDFVDRELALVIEIDSDTFHLSLSDREDDRLRRRALEEAGYTVVSVRDFDVWHRPDVVRDQVLQGRRAAKLRNLSQSSA